jgi:hypothetical protein
LLPEFIEGIRYPDNDLFAGTIAELTNTPAVLWIGDSVSAYIMNRFEDGYRLHTVMMLKYQVGSAERHKFPIL